jgi:hypothetical protein
MENTTQMFSIALDAKQTELVAELLVTRPGVTMEEFVQDMFVRGLKDCKYRTDRNKKINAEQKLEGLKLQESEKRVQEMEAQIKLLTELVEKKLAKK